jgi:hypothetical protein
LLSSPRPMAIKPYTFFKLYIFVISWRAQTALHNIRVTRRLKKRPIFVNVAKCVAKYRKLIENVKISISNCY